MRRSAVRRVVRNVLMAIAAGALVGVVVGGLGGRIAMRPDRDVDLVEIAQA